MKNADMWWKSTIWKQNVQVNKIPSEMYVLAKISMDMTIRIWQISIQIVLGYFYAPPPLKKGAYCFATVGRSVGL